MFKWSNIFTMHGHITALELAHGFQDEKVFVNVLFYTVDCVLIFHDAPFL